MAGSLVVRNQAGLTAQFGIGRDADGDHHAIGRKPTSVREMHRADMTVGVAFKARQLGVGDYLEAAIFEFAL